MMCCLCKNRFLRAVAVLPAAFMFSSAAGTETPVSPRVVESYGKLPLSFEQNIGQTDPRVKFLARASGYTLFLTSNGPVLRLGNQKTGAVLRMRVAGAIAHAPVAGVDALAGKSNYFVSKDPTRWRTNIPTYAAIKYEGVYPGIDLVFHGNQRLVEYDFRIAPGADPQAIDICFQGANKLNINTDGALVLSVGKSEVIGRPPVVYQEINGQRQAVAGRYMLRGKRRVGFSVPDYDRTRPLVIDPTVVYASYLGGSNSDKANAIAVDATGNVYITGATSSLDFPATSGQGSAFVTKLNASGSAVLYSTYLGGGGAVGNGIAVDENGNAYVTGATGANYPTTPGELANCSTDAFVTKLNATGSNLIYSTCLGGVDTASGNGIAIDKSGNAYITGSVNTFASWACTVCHGSSCPSYCVGFPFHNPGFPFTPSFSCLAGNYFEPFVTKLSSGGFLVYSTCLGPSSPNSSAFGTGIAVDAMGNAWVAGSTSSTSFPTTPGALQTTCSEKLCGFVTKLNGDGSALVYSTYLWQNSESPSIAVDPSGNAYFAYTKLTASGSRVYGGPYWPGHRVAVDALGHAYYTGQATGNGHGCEPRDPANYFPYIGRGGWYVTRLDTNGSCVATGDLDLNTAASAIAVDNSGNAYLTGTAGPGFSPTPGVVQTSFGGGDSDAFIARMSFDLPTTLASLSLSGSSSIDGCPLNPQCFQRFFTGSLTVTLSGTDPYSGIAATYYSLDGPDGPYQTYAGPFSVRDAAYRFMFYSVNTAGYAERPRELDITIDNTKPVSRAAALPPTASSPNFSVQWSGTDPDAAWLAYTIYVSDNGGPFTAWNRFFQTQAWFTGLLGHTYGFYSIADENDGNQEGAKAVAEATIHVPQMPGDVNGDGRVDCNDITVVKASFGLRSGQTGYNPAADINGDGVVDIRDLAILSQKLIPGTKCP